MADETDDTLPGPFIAPFFLGFCGVIGILGCLAPTLTMIWATAITDHQFFADTLSDLGRGPNRFIMDTGFYTYAAALLALAFGASHMHTGSKVWTGAIFCLALLSLEIVAIGLWDAFGRTADTDGISVHTKLTYGLGLLYVLGPALMWFDFKKAFPGMARLFIASAVLWIVFATAFKFAPNWIDGGLEKIAIAATMLWTIPVGYWMIKRAFHATGHSGAV